jgi:stage V sporulation protein D (sporulation-specific penicillin-binding protein)
VEENKKKHRSDQIANRRLLRRTLILLLVFGILVFIPLLGKLWSLQIVQHDELEQKAVKQQTSTLSVSASRGTIYDCNGDVLAISSTAYDIIISPKAIVEKQTSLDQLKQEAEEKVSAKNPASQYDINVRELVVNGMAEILGLDKADLESKCDDTNSQYKRLAQKVDADVEEQIRAYIEENDLSGCIYLQPNTKRYYPYSTLASQIIGFTNDNGGAYGLEATFDSQLTGKEGLVVTAKNANGTDLMNFFQDYYDAEDGSDLYLTLDANIQTLCESYLEEAIEKYYVQNGGFIIVMKCDTGAVVGMASSPSYDLNNYSTVIDSVLLDGLDEATQRYIEAGEDADTAAQLAYSSAINTMWRNKAINDTYEPGSTFKTLVLAAALEEGVTYDGDSFYCGGSIHVADRDISCSNTSGHGAQDLATAVGHSCNPVFITLGQRLGTEKFYEYLEAFGILDSNWQGTSTGIDLPGESKSIVWDYDEFGIVNLATASFGQRLQVTPIQLIAAANAVVNGGYYYQPYVVDYVEDANGNITYSADTTPLRQVISESTSSICRTMLEGVVANGLTGKNAYRAGYRIGGKTGTSQILGSDQDYVVSFLGFAPADDPEYIVLVALDTPENVGSRSYPVTRDGDYISGGNMAAPIAGDLLVDILDYANYGKQYTSDELVGADTVVPYLTGYDLATAEQICTEKGFTYRVVGSGDDSSTVQYQTAQGGNYIPYGNELVLYIGEATPPETVTMPDLTGMDPTQVSDELSSLGLYMKATGASKYYTSSTKVYSQSVEAGSAVKPGTVITISFNDTSDRDNEGNVLG